MNRILLFEKSSNVAEESQKVLKEISPCVVWAAAIPLVCELLRKQRFSILILPIETSSQLKLVSDLKKEFPHLSIVVASESNEPGFVVACLRAGAANYWHMATGLQTLKEIVAETLTRTVPVAASEQLEFPFPEFIGRHPKTLEIFKIILGIKESESTVLITGESGTGKEIVAKSIHNLSPRNKLPWIAVNCGAIPGNLLESELFGYIKGAFTGAVQNRPGRFQVAANGTIFLDEIGDLPFDLQAKVLRVIQNRVYEPVGSAYSLQMEARIIAATNQNLLKAVHERKFRQDLYYRLNVIPIFLPPLRERKSDIPLLVKNFVEKFCIQNRKPIIGICEDVMQALMEYSWPGNIRELENLIERIVVLKHDERNIEMKDLPIHQFPRHKQSVFQDIQLPDEGVDLNELVSDLENELILQALQRTSGNKNKAASLLNLNRTTLVEKLKRKGLRIAS